MKISALITSLFLFSLPAVSTLHGCDLCGCYTPQLQLAPDRTYGFFGAVTEQFTHFGEQRLDGIKVPNPADEFIDSSITQLVVGASFFHDRFALQVSVPLIYRSFQRQLGSGIDRGHASGLGDITLTANLVVFQTARAAAERAPRDSKAVLRPSPEPDFSASLQLLAGVKLPTGDASRLKENFADSGGGDEAAAPPSGIGPHDLTLGTGSVDGVFGVLAEARYKALFFQADLQYTVRGEGAYQYRFGNDLAWSGGPGIYLHRRGEEKFGVQCVLSGEAKDYDRFQGVRDGDSSITALYIGPRIFGTFGRLSADVGADLPVIMNATGLQTTPEYRIRGGLSVHF